MSEQHLGTVINDSKKNNIFSLKGFVRSDNKTELDYDGQVRLTNSWVSLDESFDRYTNENKQNIYNVKTDIQFADTGVKLAKSDLAKSDLVKLGYVIPENKFFTSLCASAYDTSVDDAGIEFIAEECDASENKINEILIIDDHGSTFQALDLNKETASPTFMPNQLAMASDSFCDLSYDSCNVNMDKQSSSLKNVNTEFCVSNQLSTAHHVPTNGIFTANSSTQSKYLNEYSHNHKNYGCNGQPEKFYSNANNRSLNHSFTATDHEEPACYSFCEGIPTPPPELGLPDLTKKHLFPNSTADSQTLPSASDAVDASALVKNKVMGLWNNVKYGWSVNLGTNFSKSSPIVLLGRVFRPSLSIPVGLVTDHLNHSSNDSSMRAFREAFYSLTWFTYRTKLHPITSGVGPQASAASAAVPDAGLGSSSELTSDCGWGCTLRCTQMMLCQALHRHFLGDDWVYSAGEPSVGLHVHHRLVRWFGDGLGRAGESPLSLHQLVQCGAARLGKAPGDWYTPSNAATATRDAVDACYEYMPDLQRVSVYTSVNNVIYIQDILDQCWIPCICKLGKIAEYVKQRPRASSASRLYHCNSGLGDRFRRCSASADALDSVEVADAFSSFVQIDDSVPCDVNSSTATSQFYGVSGKTNARDTRSNVEGYGNSRSRIFLGRSFSVDESEAFHIVNKNKMTDSDVSENQLTDSFYEVDVPFNITNPSPASSRIPYYKASFSQKLFGSYNPFKSNNSKPSPLAAASCPAVRGSTATLGRQDSLDCGTLTLLSPILEQDRLCPDCHSWRSLILLVAVRMGGDAFNAVYETVVTALLRHPLCLGLVGGRARRAFYFVGYQEDQLLYLDPHSSQEAVPCSWSTLPDVTTYHCDAPRKMPLSRLEPSATLGFYCHTRTDFAQLVVDLPKLTTVREGRMCYPLVEVKAGCRQDQESAWSAECFGMMADLTSPDADCGTQRRHSGVKPIVAEKIKHRPKTQRMKTDRRKSAGKLDGFQLVD